MPSPIAHCSLIMPFWLVARRWIGDGLSGRGRKRLAFAMLFALMAPDADALAGLVSGQGVGRYHNGFTNSLVCAVMFGCLFMLFCRRFLGWPRRVLFALGGSAYLSHVVMDAFNSRGRGVQFFWPFSDARFASPVPLFFGVIHSVDAPWSIHLVTIVNELFFAAAVFVACAWWRSRQRSGLLRET